MTERKRVAEPESDDDSEDENLGDLLRGSKRRAVQTVAETKKGPVTKLSTSVLAHVLDFLNVLETLRTFSLVSKREFAPAAAVVKQMQTTLTLDPRWSALVLRYAHPEEGDTEEELLAGLVAAAVPGGRVTRLVMQPDTFPILERVDFLGQLLDAFPNISEVEYVRLHRDARHQEGMEMILALPKLRSFVDLVGHGVAYKAIRSPHLERLNTPAHEDEILELSVETRHGIRDLGQVTSRNRENFSALLRSMPQLTRLSVIVERSELLERLSFDSPQLEHLTCTLAGIRAGWSIIPEVFKSTFANLQKLRGLRSLAITNKMNSYNDKTVGDVWKACVEAWPEMTDIELGLRVLDDFWQEHAQSWPALGRLALPPAVDETGKIDAVDASGLVRFWQGEKNHARMDAWPTSIRSAFADLGHWDKLYVSIWSDAPVVAGGPCLSDVRSETLRKINFNIGTKQSVTFLPSMIKDIETCVRSCPLLESITFYDVTDGIGAARALDSRQGLFFSVPSLAELCSDDNWGPATPGTFSGKAFVVGKCSVWRVIDHVKLAVRAAEAKAGLPQALAESKQKILVVPVGSQFRMRLRGWSDVPPLNDKERADFVSKYYIIAEETKHKARIGATSSFEVLAVLSKPTAGLKLKSDAGHIYVLRLLPPREIQGIDGLRIDESERAGRFTLKQQATWATAEVGLAAQEVFAALNSARPAAKPV